MWSRTLTVVHSSNGKTASSWRIWISSNMWTCVMEVCIVIQNVSSCTVTKTSWYHFYFNPLTSNDSYRSHTATLISKRCTLYIYSTNIGTEYFKYDIHSPCFSLQNAVCFIILPYLVLVLVTLYIQDVLKLKKFPAPKS